MSRDFSKELIIALLVILATMLLIGVFLYDFVPNNKIIPEDIEYTTAQDVKDELKSVEGFDADEVLMTYSLDSSELYNYQVTNDYRPGKTNPFSTYITQSEENSDKDGGSAGNKSSSGNKTGNGSSDNTSGGGKSKLKPGEVNPGNYTNDKGLK